MSSNVDGFMNETNLILYLKDKNFNDLNNNMKRFMLFLFPNIQPEDNIEAKNGKSGQKPDIEIIVNNISKNVSVKKGTGNSVHQESVYLFMDFLRSINVNHDAITELLKFHWADETDDGNGSCRLSSREYKKNHPNEIAFINKELNNPIIAKKIINRLLFQGKDNSYDTATYIYHGNINQGKWASNDEVFDYIENNDFFMDTVHIGPLSYQSWNSCLNYNPNTENRRKVMQAKWGSLNIDLIKIERKRNSNE